MVDSHYEVEHTPRREDLETILVLKSGPPHWMLEFELGSSSPSTSRGWIRGNLDNQILQQYK